MKTLSNVHCGVFSSAPTEVSQVAVVMFIEWHQTALDPKSNSCLPMTGEDTGLGALASPLAGYLGKVS